MNWLGPFQWSFFAFRVFLRILLWFFVSNGDSSLRIRSHYYNLANLLLKGKLYYCNEKWQRIQKFWKNNQNVPSIPFQSQFEPKPHYYHCSYSRCMSCHWPTIHRHMLYSMFYASNYKVLFQLQPKFHCYVSSWDNHLKGETNVIGKKISRMR